MEKKIVKVFEHKEYQVYVSRDGQNSMLVQLAQITGSQTHVIETLIVPFEERKKLRKYEELDKEVDRSIVNMIAKAKNIQKKVTMADNILNKLEKKYGTGE